MSTFVSYLWHGFMYLCIFNCYMNWIAYVVVSDETLERASTYVPDEVAEVWRKRKPPHFQTIMCILFLIILIQENA